MAYITTAERIGMERGYEQGMEKGIEKGIAYERRLLNKLLIHRFGVLSSDTARKLKQADPDTLLQWGEKALDAKTIKEVFGE